MVRSHAGIFYKSEMKQTVLWSKSLRVEESPERPVTCRREMWRREFSLHRTRSWTKHGCQLSCGQGARATAGVRTAHLFGNPWPPDPWMVLNKSTQEPRPTCSLVPGGHTGTCSPQIATSPPTPFPQHPYCEG